MEGPGRGRQSQSHKAREFVCGCGKTYLSNPALFTHVKQKHGGKQPEGVKKPNSLYDRRGRPSLTMIREKQIQLKNDHVGEIAQAEHKQMVVGQSSSGDKFEEIFAFLKEIKKSEVIESTL